MLIGLDEKANHTLRVEPGTPAAWSVQLSDSAADAFPDILGAGPRLLVGGEVHTTGGQEEFRPDVLAPGPRTAVGWNAAGQWLLLVVDGRQPGSVGLDLPQTAALFKELGAVEAMNLDGGSSTQLVVNGVLMNRPSALDPVDPTQAREVQVMNALTLSQ